MARVYNNEVSTAFTFFPEAKEFMNNLQKTSNFFNQILLATPLFHGSMTLGESFVSRANLAVAQALGGRFGAAATAAATVPLAPLGHYSLGAELNKAYENPGTGSEAMQKAVEYFTRARASFGKNYDPTTGVNTQRAFQDSIRLGSLTREWNEALGRVSDKDTVVGKSAQAISEFAGLLSKTFRSLSAPLFDTIIPNIKSGVNAEQFMAWMEANPKATDAQHLATAQRIAKATDSALGEMRYDNLFWNKTMTQVMQTYMLAPSYTVGTLNLLSGGTKTLATHPTRAGINSVNWDPRSSYVVALPLVVLLSNAIYQYLKTGEGPADLTDALLGPKTGGKTPNGDDERAALPGYWRQVTGTWNAPWQEAYNKMGALPKAIYEEGLTNKDYRNLDIADPRNNIIKRIFDHAVHMGQNIEPIAAQNLQRGQLRGSNISTGETIAGIRPASTRIESPGRIAAIQAAADKRDIDARNRANLRDLYRHQQ
jgi:hypothetical protein